MSYQTWLKPWESLSSMTKCTHSWLVPGKLSSLLCHYFIHSILLSFIFILEYLFNLFHVILIVAYRVAWVKEVVLWELEKPGNRRTSLDIITVVVDLFINFLAFSFDFCSHAYGMTVELGQVIVNTNRDHLTDSLCEQQEWWEMKYLETRWWFSCFPSWETLELLTSLNPLDLLSKGGTRD